MQKIRITFMAILMAVLCSCASTEEKILTHPNHPDQQIDLTSPDIVKDLDDGKLKIWYIAKGTRSEGLHGEIEGIRIFPEKGMEIQTKIGTLIYLGSCDERPLLFSRSGWLPVDSKDIYPSWKHIQSGDGQ